MKIRTILLSVTLLPLFCGCSDEQSTENNNLAEQITQHWELKHAERNGRKTETLVDAFLKLENNGTAMVNIDGTPQSAKWTVSGTHLTISETRADYLATDYKITDLGDSTLTLDVELRNTPFTMQFHIATREEPKEDLQ